MRPPISKNRRKRPARHPGQLLRHVLRQRAAPEDIALGMALGVVVAFSPTVGIQIPLAFLLATALRANRIAALTPIGITNVFTVPAIYGFTYRIGHLFLPGREPGKVRRLLAAIRDDLVDQGIPSPGSAFRAFTRLGGDLLAPMLIGGLVVGLVGAAIAYPVTLHLVRRSRQHRSRRLQRRAEERRTGTGFR